MDMKGREDEGARGNGRREAVLSSLTIVSDKCNLLGSGDLPLCRPRFFRSVSIAQDVPLH